MTMDATVIPLPKKFSAPADAYNDRPTMPADARVAWYTANAAYMRINPNFRGQSVAPGAYAELPKLLRQLITAATMALAAIEHPEDDA